MLSRLGYRFCVIYLGLFAVASQFLGGLILLPGFSFPPLGTVWPMRDLTYWLGTNVFHVTTLAYQGVSGDTPFHWVQLAWIAAVSAVAAAVWTIVDARRLKPAPTSAMSGRLKPAPTLDTTGRLKPAPTSAESDRLEPAPTSAESDRLEPAPTSDITGRLKPAPTSGKSGRVTSDVGSGFSRTADYWIRLFFRFVLAAQMFYFGMAKVIPTQFPPPSLVTLVKPVGDLTPDDLLWTFMGASVGYQMFTGWAELAAGVLLVIPRTAVVGALLAFADMLQVFVLNMSYDVGLKQISFHLLAISLFVLWPDIKRLSHALVFDRPRASRRALWIQLAFGAYLLAMFTRLAALSWYNPGGPGYAKSPLYGIWDVEKMSVDGDVRPPIFNDYDRRWRRVIFDTPDLVIFERLDDSFAHFGATVDGHTIALRKLESRLWHSSFSYDRRGDDEMTIDGDMDGHTIHAELQRVGTDVFRLTNGTFRWVRPPG